MSAAETDFSWAERLVERGLAGLKRLNGYYHDNYAVQQDGKSYLLRAKRRDPGTIDPRQYLEADVLHWLQPHGYPTAQVLYCSPSLKFEIHSFIDGQSLGELYPGTAELNTEVSGNIAMLMARLHSIQWSDEAGLPFRNVCKKTDAFFQYLLSFLKALYENLWNKNPDVFNLYDFPADLTAVLKSAGHIIGERQTTLCHGDMHTNNLMSDPVGKLYVVDWELALWGDPLFDIAVHICRTGGYTEDGERLLLSRYLKQTKQISEFEKMKEQLELYKKFEIIRLAVVRSYRYSIPSLKPTERFKGDDKAMKLADTLRSAHAIWAEQS